MSCSVFCICSYLYIISEWGGQGCRGDIEGIGLIQRWAGLAWVFEKGGSSTF